jgi:hypothetical protein
MAVTPQQRREREAAFRDAVADAFDIGKGAPRIRDSMEAAIDEAVETVAERGSLRAAVFPRDVQAAQAALRAKKAELRGEPSTPATRTDDPRREQLGAWLASLTLEQRDALLGSDALRDLSDAEQGFVFRRMAELETEELGADGAELRHSLVMEEQKVRAIDFDAESQQWQREHEDSDAWAEALAARLTTESDAVNADWSAANAAYGLSDDEVADAAETVAGLQDDERDAGAFAYYDAEEE